MPALTRIQLDHAKQRLAEAKKKYVAAKVAELGPEPAKIDLGNEEKMARIKTGQATLKSDTEAYTYLCNAFVYHLTPTELAQKVQHEAWCDKRDAINVDATAIEQRVVDELVMSPDGMSALAKIAAAFEN